MPVSFSRHPFGAREMAIEGTAGALDIAIRVYVQHDPRNLAPVGTFRIGIQHPQIRDGVLLVVRCERWLCRGKVGNVRVEWRHGFLAVAQTRPIVPGALRQSRDMAQYARDWPQAR
jgi:hypothetical protein